MSIHLEEKRKEKTMEEFRTQRNAILCISCTVLKLNHGILAESGVVKAISNGQQCLDLPTLYHLTSFIQQSIFIVTRKLYRDIDIDARILIDY